MYTDKMLESMKKVELSREARIGQNPRRMTAKEKDDLLKECHPDYIESAFTTLSVGANKGQKVPCALAELLQGKSRVLDKEIDLDDIKYQADVLVIGGGGSGASAALEAYCAGCKVTMVTKLRIGDANTMMAEGGIQAADKENDNPAIHYLDAFGGGHFTNKPELLMKLVYNAPGAIKWLNDLGVMFDKDADGTMATTAGGGTSRNRMHACADYSGAEIMRVLRDEVWNDGIEVVEFTSAIEILKDDKGNAAGAILLNMETGEVSIAKAKTVILCTGGAGRLHYQDFPTTNHYGATADGLVLAYRAGGELRDADAIQYHPTGVAYPQQMRGALVTEKVRGIGAMLVNVDGEAFMNPLECRDITSSSIIRECRKGKGVPTPLGDAIWLDSPMIDMIHGEGYLEKKLPGMLRMYAKMGIDMRKEPILIYPTLHYQNGGVDVNADSMSTTVNNLYIAGECAGGVHGRNRLMGNSLLDVIVFGRNAGQYASKRAKEIEMPTKLNYDHVAKFDADCKAAGIEYTTESPRLLPNYINIKKL